MAGAEGQEGNPPWQRRGAGGWGLSGAERLVASGLREAIV